MTARLLFDGDHLQVLYDDRGGDTLLITFNEMDQFANGLNYWGQAPAAKLSLSCVGFVSKRRNWFPAVDMQVAAAALDAITPAFRHRVCYGFSQGAYGAIKYSGLLMATHVLAFSPQWTINPDTTDDRRFSRWYVDGLHRGMEIGKPDVAGEVTMFADPHDPSDWSHVQRIGEAIDGGHIVPVFHLGHATVRAVSSVPAVAALLATCLEDPLDPAKFAALIRHGKKGTFFNYIALGMCLVRHNHLGWAREVYERAARLSPDHAHLRILRDGLAAAETRRRRPALVACMPVA